MSLSYDGRKIAPAPLVTINKSYRASEDGSKLGTQYEINLTGTLLPFRGSPSGHYASLDAAFWTLGGSPPDEPYRANNEDFNAILRKQEAMRWLFSRDGKSLEWQPGFGQPVVKCNPRVIGIDFAEGSWADRCDYSVQLAADWLYINGSANTEDTCASGLIESASEEWSFEEVEGWVGSGFRVTHTVTANGVAGYDENGSLFQGKEAWQHAQAWCESRVTGGIDSAVLQAITGQTGWIGGDYSRAGSANTKGGDYKIAETWLICPTATFTEKTFSVEYSTETDEYRVRCEGAIHTISSGRKLGAPEAIAIAKAAVPSATTARDQATAMVLSLTGGRALAIAPDSHAIGINQKEGNVSFSFEWTTGTTPNYTEAYEAVLAYSADNGLHTLNLSGYVQGKGETAETRLTNARAASLNDTNARLRALAIIGSMLPAGVAINSTPRSRSTSFNERQGRISLAWGWDSSPENNLEVSVNIQNRAPIAAVIPIPGRPGGPIIQEMNTVTEKVANVTIRGKGYATRPDSVAMQALADGYLGIPSAGLIVTGDSENWSPINKTYDRTIKYLVREGY